MKDPRSETNFHGRFVFAVLPALLFLFLASAANGATFTVTNTNDAGPGSLRQAIIDSSSASGLDTIAFNIPGTGVKKIAPLTNLPTVVGPVILDGTTQPGWSVGNLMIEISGENNNNAQPIGLLIISQNDPAASFIRGLVVNRFAEVGIQIQDSSNVTVEGCYIGTDASGSFARGNNIGVHLRGTGFGQIENIVVGGDTPAERNIISGNTFRGIDVFTLNNAVIKGNYIGTDKAGRYSIANGTAIRIFATGVTVGGPNAADGNVISGNLGAVNFDIRDHTIQNNHIGVAADGISPLGNRNSGISIVNSDFVTRGNHLITQNIVANNGGDGGINLFPSFSLHTIGNRISENLIFNNAANNPNNPAVAIDLDFDGPTANDPGDGDVGTNNLQNFPVLTSATANIGTTTTILGTLNSAPSTSYRIEFFSNPSNRRETRKLLGFQNVTTNSTGNAVINATVSAITHAGEFVTATATRNTTPFDTSEVSETVPVVVATFVVTNTNDSGAGSLRQAILNANVNPDSNLITFSIVPLDETVKTINLTSPLPAMVNPVSIDGLTQSGGTCDTPKIELDGTSAGAGAEGLTFTADNNRLQGIVINRFGGEGALFDSSLTNIIRCNKIGTDAAGNSALANGGSGIFLDTSHFNTIEQNTLSSNSGAGIRGQIAQFNSIAGNTIGLNSAGTAVLANGSGGIVLSFGHSNVIGGTTAAKRNVVSGNGLVGILISNSFNNRVKGNYVGVDSTGSGTTFGNSGSGVLFTNASADDNVVGGQEIGAGNIIAHNIGDGITFLSTAGTGNQISGNSIHSNGGLGVDLTDNGVTANDVGDADAGTNNFQNFPVITSAEAYFGGFKITGTLNSTANTEFRIEIFSNPTCDASGNGEGQTFQDSIEVVTNGAGNVSFTHVSTSAAVPIGHVVTATAMRRAAPFDTSEFSACRIATALSIPTMTVTNTNDSGSGSLRQLIIDANADSVPNHITFNIPGSFVRTITPATPLPQITQPVIIDALTQPGASCTNPLIELNGQSAGTGTHGLHVSGSADIRGLVINRFNGNGLLFDTTGNNSVRCSRIGTDATGVFNLGNGRSGIFFDTVSNNTIGGPGEGNLISSNNTISIPSGGGAQDAGVRAFNSSNNIVRGNIIGPRIDGVTTLVRMRFGVIFVGGSNNQIGGATAAARNVINSCGRGIGLQNSNSNRVQGNYLGLRMDGEGGNNIANEQGVFVNASRDNLIGGSASGEGNVISNSADLSTIQSAGIFIGGSTSLNTIVQGNIIGLNAAGTTAVGNTIGVYVLSDGQATIGGNLQERNIISGNGTGVVIEGDADAVYNASRVTGNYIGLNAAGTFPVPNLNGVQLTGDTRENVISGNVISGNTQAGLSLASSSNLIRGNLIGVSPGGFGDRGNGTGILLNDGAQLNNIGGANVAFRNIISGNDLGIATASGAVTAGGNQIVGNYIGTATDGTTAMPNSQHGILLESSNNTIANNTIALNSQKGIVILATGTGNRISTNSIFSNGTTAAHLGIDLGNNGVTPNDTGDGDLVANNQQNYPVVTSITATTVNGSLNSTPNSQFVIELFSSVAADASGFGEGSIYVGSTTVTTNAAGDAGFAFARTLPLAGRFVTMTATSASGDTSEFSLAVRVSAPTAAEVSIAGRIMTEDGRGIPRVAVTLLKPDGSILVGQSSHFGYFRFVGLVAGQSYVIQFSSKSYVFEAGSIQLTPVDSIDDLIVIGSYPNEPDEGQSEKIPVHSEFPAPIPEKKPDM